MNAQLDGGSRGYRGRPSRRQKWELMTTSSTDHDRPLEVEKLLTALDALGPRALTSCPGWCAHDVAAHSAGNYQEVRLHLEAFAGGQPLQRTRSHEEREPLLRQLPYDELIALVEREEVAMRRALTEVLEQDSTAWLRWTARTVPARGFGTHMRSEDALHRWDLVGDDEDSATLLAQPELLEHALEFIGAPLWREGLRRGAGDRALRAVVRADGHDDLRVITGDGTAHVSVVEPEGEATLLADAAARLLLLWGRKAMPFHRLRAAGDEQDVRQVQLLFSGS